MFPALESGLALLVHPQRKSVRTEFTVTFQHACRGCSINRRLRQALARATSSPDHVFETSIGHVQAVWS